MRGPPLMSMILLWVIGVVVVIYCLILIQGAGPIRSLVGGVGLFYSRE